MSDYTRIDGELEDFNENKQLYKKHISHIEDELDSLEDKYTQLNQSLTDKLGSAKIEVSYILGGQSATFNIGTSTTLFFCGMHHGSSYGLWLCSSTGIAELFSVSTSATVSLVGTDSIEVVNNSSGTRFRYVAIYWPA